MISSTPSTSHGLVRPPRTTRQHLIPLHTNFTDEPTDPSTNTAKTNQSTTRAPNASPSLASDFLFASATIPLSPASSTSPSTSPVSKEAPFAGLAPRKRSPIARLFFCFGREETARRKVMREMEYENVGKEGHWTEY